MCQYETHRFLQVDGGQRDPQKLGRNNSFKSSLDLTLSFVFTSTFMIVLKILSKKFFSMCLTSKLCLIMFVFH